MSYYDDLRQMVKDAGLGLGVWDSRPITYEQWVTIAGDLPAAQQTRAWQSHEFWGRRKLTEARLFDDAAESWRWVEIGGEG